MTMGWVVAAPGAIPPAGNRPEGGGFTPERGPEPGGDWIFGGPAGAFSSGADVSGGFLSFLPKEKKGITTGNFSKACQACVMVHYYQPVATRIIDA
jgi:hypothetical protein